MFAFLSRDGNVLITPRASLTPVMGRCSDINGRNLKQGNECGEMSCMYSIYNIHSFMHR